MSLEEALFVLDNNKLDPYLGVILGYDVGTFDLGEYDNFFGDTTYGGVVFGVQFGVRYWFSPSMAVNARLGTGSNSGSSLDLGVDFKF